MNDVVPGILEKEWSEIERKLELVKPFAKTVHIDIIDGGFADNTTFLDPEPFRKYTKDFLFELHMMVENPIQYVKPWADAGFRRFIGHVEQMPHQENFLTEARKYGEGGLAIDGPTSVSEIVAPLHMIDTILIMDITAGFSGQKFTEIYLLKIKELKDRGYRGVFEVDGGITSESLIKAKHAGATRFVTTSFLFESENPSQTFQLLVNI